MGGWLVWELAICLVFTWAVPRQRKGFSRPIWSAPVSSPASSGPASSRAVCSPHPTGGTTERPGSPACWSRTANFGQSAIGRPWSPAWIRAPCQHTGGGQTGPGSGPVFQVAEGLFLFIGERSILSAAQGSGLGAALLQLGGIGSRGGRAEVVAA
jgi:hypothetical protein